MEVQGGQQRVGEVQGLELVTLSHFQDVGSKESLEACLRRETQISGYSVVECDEGPARRWHRNLAAG